MPSEPDNDNISTSPTATTVGSQPFHVKVSREKSYINLKKTLEDVIFAMESNNKNIFWQHKHIEGAMNQMQTLTQSLVTNIDTIKEYQNRSLKNQSSNEQLSDNSKNMTSREHYSPSAITSDCPTTMNSDYCTKEVGNSSARED